MVRSAASSTGFWEHPLRLSVSLQAVTFDLSCCHHAGNPATLSLGLPTEVLAYTVFDGQDDLLALATIRRLLLELGYVLHPESPDNVVGPLQL